MRLLILGGGAVVSEFYLGALARLRWTDGIAVADLDAAALKRVATAAPWARTHALGFSEAIRRARDSKSADAVVVALPNSLHAEAVACALEAGFPVLCEKPLAMSATACGVLGEKSVAAGKPLAVAMVRRLLPSIQAAMAAIRTGQVGAIREVVVEHGGPYAWSSDSGAFFRRENGGILADLGVHYLDLLGSIFGPLTPVRYEDDWRGGVEASFTYQLKARDSIDIVLRVSHLRRCSDTIEFRGEHGAIVVDRTDFAACRLSGTLKGFEVSLRPEQPFVDPAWPLDFTSCFAQQLHDFARVVEGAPAAGAQEAAGTMALVEHAYCSRIAGTRRADQGPRLAPGRIVVTGGTGFIGGALVERLSDLGLEDIVVPVRGYRTCANVARFAVELPRVDLTDRDQVRRMVKGARWVFHLAYGQTESSAEAVTVGATLILVEEAAAAGAEAVVVLSTMGVFGDPDSGGPVDESWSYSPAYGSYGKTKARMEQWCLERGRALGKTRLVVLNPTCVYGPGGKAYTALPAELAKAGRFAWIEGGSGVANYCYVDNLLDAMLLVAGKPEADRQRYLVNDGYASWREMIEPLLGDLRGRVPSLSLDALLAGAGAKMNPSTLREIAGALLNNYRLIELVNRHQILGPMKRLAVRRFRGRMESARAGDVQAGAAGAIAGPPVPPPWLAELFGPTRTRFSSGKLRALGWAPRVDLPEGQRRALDWLMASGALR